MFMLQEEISFGTLLYYIQGVLKYVNIMLGMVSVC